MTFLLHPWILIWVILTQKYNNNSMLYRTNSNVVTPHVLYIEVYHKNPVKCWVWLLTQSIQNKTSQTPHKLYLFMPKITNIQTPISAHWPMAWAARESLESWNLGRHQRMGKDFQHRLTPATTSVPRTGIPAWLQDRDRRGSVPPWVESTGAETQAPSPRSYSTSLFWQTEGITFLVRTVNTTYFSFVPKDWIKISIYNVILNIRTLKSVKWFLALHKLYIFLIITTRSQKIED